MSKEKDYFVPTQTKIVDVAELFAREVSGEKSGAAFERVKKKFLDEAIQESVLPADSVYRQNPKISDSVMKEFPFAFGAESVLAKSYPEGSAKRERKIREFRGLITQLTHLLLESRMKMSVKGAYDGKEYLTSDFEYESDSSGDESKMREVEVNRYIRLFMFTGLMQALEPMMKITVEEMKEILNGLEIYSDPVAKLRSKSERQRFIASIKVFFSKIFGTESAVKKGRSS